MASIALITTLLVNAIAATVVIGVLLFSEFFFGSTRYLFGRNTTDYLKLVGGSLIFIIPLFCAYYFSSKETGKE